MHGGVRGRGNYLIFPPTRFIEKETELEAEFNKLPQKFT